jgi:hypothetical protein
LVGATPGCDDGSDGDGLEPTEFRSEGGDPQVQLAQQTTTSFKIKGCDPPFPIYRPGADLSEAPEEWLAMIDVQARRIADETLVAAFLAQGSTHEFCTAACEEAGSAWDGGAALVAEGHHEFGELQIEGECPFGTLATSLPAASAGDVGCTCEQ